MYNLSLIGFFIFLLALLIYPIYKSKLFALLAFLGLFILSIVVYINFGNLKAFHEYETKKRALKILSSFKSEEELIQALRSKLDDTPKSAYGWQLLGKLYTA